VETLIISQSEVRELLSMSACIEVVREALAGLARGEGIQPLRPIMWLPERVGALGMMPGYLGSIDTMGIKTVTVFPGNAGTEYDSHQGSVMLFDGANGRLKAVIDATEITAIRTAAASAVATDLLARPDSSVLAILGSGVQAGTHLEAIPHARPISEVRVWSRQPENADRLVESSGSSGLSVAAVSTVAEAVAGADIVCTTTASSDPVLLGALLEPGMHINAVGSSVPFARELDGEALGRSRLFVDRRESTLNEAGVYLMAKDEGAVNESDILAEIGELLIGAAEGRRDDDEITLFKSLGLAVEDIAAGDLVYRNAIAAGAGTRLELGGARHG
jgi:ornithine cyclodeaminase